MSRDTLHRLAATITARATADPGESWTAALLAQGPAKTAQKFGEEAVEAIIACMQDDQHAFVAEAADTLFHLLVMLHSRGVTLDQVLAELDRREGTSGITEKANRS